jgi:hypothetical protein
VNRIGRRTGQLLVNDRPHKRREMRLEGAAKPWWASIFQQTGQHRITGGQELSGRSVGPWASWLGIGDGSHGRSLPQFCQLAPRVRT